MQYKYYKKMCVMQASKITLYLNSLVNMVDASLLPNCLVQLNNYIKY